MHRVENLSSKSSFNQVLLQTYEQRESLVFQFSSLYINPQTSVQDVPELPTSVWLNKSSPYHTHSSAI